MADLIYTVDRLSDLEASLYEEDSYSFLSHAIESANWYVYDSDQLGLQTVKVLADQFCAFHGKISFPEEIQEDQNIDGFWSSVPLEVFRYKLSEDGSVHLVNSYKKIPGYIVEGAYWINGFVYLVRNESDILQLKLFIDQDTKLIQLYPDIQSL